MFAKHLDVKTFEGHSAETVLLVSQRAWEVEVARNQVNL